MTKRSEKSVVIPPSGARSDKSGEPATFPSTFENVAPINPYALPLFPQLGKQGPHPSYVKLYRTEPFHARGDLGVVHEVNITEDQIAEKFGGGTYLLEVYDDQNKVIRGGKTTKQIPGEPKVSSNSNSLLPNDRIAGKGVAEILKAEREFSERQFSQRLSEQKLAVELERERRKMDLEEIRAKARAEREEWEERRKAEREEERERHAREIEREKLAFEQRKEELRLAAERAEREARESRERDREHTAAMMQMQQSLMQVAIGAMSNNQQVMVQAISSQRSDASQMFGAFQQGMQLMGQMGGQNADPSTEALKALTTVVDKGFETYGTVEKTKVLAERNRILEAKGLPAPPAQAQKNPAPAHEPAKAPQKPAKPAKAQKNPTPAHEPAHEPAKAPHEPDADPFALPSNPDEMQALLGKEAEALVMEMMKRGINPREVMEDIRRQITGEITPEELLAEDEPEEEEPEEEEVDSPDASDGKAVEPSKSAGDSDSRSTAAKS